MSDFLGFICAFVLIGLVCLWGALCVLCIGGWIISQIGGGILVRPLGRGFFTGQQAIQGDIELIEDTEDAADLADNSDADLQVQGMTWNALTLWILAFFIWPVFVAMALDYYFNPSSRAKSSESKR